MSSNFENAALSRVRAGSFVPHSIRFNHIVDAVEARCMAADGPVTPTLQEISEKELAALWRAVRGMRVALDDAEVQRDALVEALNEIVKACPFNLDDAGEGGPHPGLIAIAALVALRQA